MATVSLTSCSRGMSRQPGRFGEDATTPAFLETMPGTPSEAPRTSHEPADQILGTGRGAGGFAMEKDHLTGAGDPRDTHVGSAKIETDDGLSVPLCSHQGRLPESLPPMWLYTARWARSSGTA